MKLSGESVVSRTMRRSAGVRRRRRGRVSGKDIVLAETTLLGTLGGFRTSRAGLGQAEPGLAHAQPTLVPSAPRPRLPIGGAMRTLRRYAWAAIILLVAPVVGAATARSATVVGQDGRVVRAASGP